ncbi:MAG: HAD-IA family hydrolase [Alphaproteobacteria bacterium]|nr:MAG: HAD family hydrolase [Alphaproteobacteria bacterium]|tara:strand:- start:232 stop:864 length:633 start_codon:yes stop_codon:yes gene_type:complete
MTIKTIIFDFGGVITNSPIEGFKLLEEKHGYDKGIITNINMNNPDNNAWAKSERGEIDINTFLEEFEKEALSIGQKINAKEILQQLYGSLRKNMINKIKLLSTSKKYKLICLTNVLKGVDIFTPKERVEAVKDVMSYFDIIYESYKLNMRKPEARIYQYILKELNIEPQETVFLDDLGMNLKSARKLGINTIKVIEPNDAIYELDQILER